MPSCLAELMLTVLTVLSVTHKAAVKMGAGELRVSLFECEMLHMVVYSNPQFLVGGPFFLLRFT